MEHETVKIIVTIACLFIISCLVTYFIALALNYDSLGDGNGNIANRLIFAVGLMNSLLIITFGVLIYKKK